MSDKETLNVLLIEDNEGDAFLLKFYLSESETYSFNFDHAETLSAAFSSLAVKKYDIVLMDLGLPDSQGLTGLKKLLEDFPNNLVIVLTGLMDEKIGLESVRYGAQDFLVKGRFDSKVLASSIVFAFERFSLNQKLTSANAAISAGYERFKNLQELTRIGYFDINLETQEHYISPYIAKMLGYKDSQSITVEEASVMVENLEEVNSLFYKAVEAREDGSLPIKSKLFSQPVIMRWQIHGNKLICAVIYPEN